MLRVAGYEFRVSNEQAVYHTRSAPIPDRLVLETRNPQPRRRRVNSQRALNRLFPSLAEVHNRSYFLDLEGYRRMKSLGYLFTKYLGQPRSHHIHFLT
jgi:hypothetical protein